MAQKADNSDHVNCRWGGGKSAAGCSEATDTVVLPARRRGLVSKAWLGALGSFVGPHSGPHTPRVWLHGSLAEREGGWPKRGSHMST